MGWPFVRRRMTAELGPGWQNTLPELRAQSGRRRLARPGPPRRVACRRAARREAAISRHASAVEADLRQLELLFSIHRRMDPAIDTTEIAEEIAARLREELDYRPRGQAHRALSRDARRRVPRSRVPPVVAGAVDAAAAHHGLARRRQLLELQGPFPGRAQSPRPRHVQGLVACRSAAMA